MLLRPWVEPPNSICRIAPPPARDREVAFRSSRQPRDSLHNLARDVLAM